MSNLSDYMKDPNGPAYRKEEIRNGPPLEYVSEKIRNALDEQHKLLKDIECNPQFWPDLERRQLETECLVYRSAISSFNYQITAFLALHNMLGVNSGYDYTQRLCSMSRDEFEQWLEFIEREGSVSGL